SLWLALTDGDHGRLHGMAEVVGSAALVRKDSFAAPAPIGSVLSSGAAADSHTAKGGFPVDRDEPFDVCVRGFGPSGGVLAARLAAEIQAWHAAGRPSTTNLEIEACAADTAAESIIAAYIVNKPHARLGLSFGERTKDSVGALSPPAR
ncbi:MAG TPA: hypothetical protein VE287_05715, partial [Actinopolymorphaceae bacterium]|nr:hypothetical protein [Actinopolymorphaceae bacterium]